ncbi:MAG: efflux RND transporter periplasmic adaptor subunit [bacterium]|nr:efflux RND transporter periplasmic adaptor subunit [bacterium]
MIRTIKKHKIASIIILLLIIGGVYYGYNKFKASSIKPAYITSAVEKGTLIISVSSSGQISAANQVDITSKVSGDIKKIAVAGGQTVKAGDLIAQIDATNAYKTVRDANTNLQSAQLAMDKLKQPVDSYSLMQAENALTNAKTNLEKLKLSQPVDYQTAVDNKKKAEDDLSKTYEDAFNTVANVYLDLPTIMTVMDNVLYSKEISESEATIGQSYGNIAVLENSMIDSSDSEKTSLKLFQARAESDYKIARGKYDLSFLNYKNSSRYSDRSAIEALLAETLETTKLIAQSAKSESNYLDAWVDSMSKLDLTIFSKVNEYQTNLATYIGQTNSHLSSLLSTQSTINNNKNALVSAVGSLKEIEQNNPFDLAAAEASVKEKQASLIKLQAGTDSLDIRSQELSLQQKRNALIDAQTALADYTIRAPFDGVVAAVNAKVGDSASGVITTIMTAQHIAEISLNEVDVAKIKIGNKATLTFDAIDGLDISGRVAEIDALGAVTQGVVTYNVKIVFDTQDSRVKSGMSANATIITNVKTDILLVPNSAVKTDSNGGSYVQTLDSAGQPQNVIVQIGLANDNSAEIISGLNEGDKVVTQTITAGATNTITGQSGAAGGLRIPGITGGSGGGGNNFRRIGN